MRRLANESDLINHVPLQQVALQNEDGAESRTLDDLHLQPLTALFALKGWPAPVFHPISQGALPDHAAVFFRGH